jgi:hypothetical protein
MAFGCVGAIMFEFLLFNDYSVRVCVFAANSMKTLS